MKLWGGRFTKEENQLVHNFNASITFDQKFYHQDIQGSIAHVTMLAKQAIITDAERDIIISAKKSAAISNPANYRLQRNMKISTASWNLS